jgi:hypothetical protein
MAHKLQDRKELITEEIVQMRTDILEMIVAYKAIYACAVQQTSFPSQYLGIVTLEKFFNLVKHDLSLREVLPKDDIQKLYLRQGISNGVNNCVICMEPNSDNMVYKCKKCYNACHMICWLNLAEATYEMKCVSCRSVLA